MKKILIMLLRIAVLTIIALMTAFILWILKKYWAIAMLVILPIFLILVVYGAYKNDKDREE